MIRVGDIQIKRIVEIEEPFLSIGKMFPDVGAEALARHRHWLEPWALCPDSGRIILPVQSYLIETTRHTILIDSCVGNRKSNRFFEPWHDRRSALWLERLTAAGASPESIDVVLCTHLHLDHCGWNTRLVDGRWLPTFPKARYLFAKEEFDHRQGLGDSTFNENVLPVMEAGQGEIVAADHALDDEVWLMPTPGHTPGHVSIHLASRGQEAVMMGDIMHSPVQCAEPDWHCISDSDPALASTTRRRFLDQHAESAILILTAHFPSPSVGHLVCKDDAFRFAF